MHWNDEAEAAIKKVPFFVRGKVRARVEQEAAAAGCRQVTLTEVRASQRRFLAGMAEAVKGFQVDTCFAAGGCPHRIADSPALADRIETLLRESDLRGFLESRVAGPLKFHHEFRVSLADCPNSCSQVQIKDVGIIAACAPRVTEAPCSHCGACAEACPDNAVTLADDDGPAIDAGRCMRCGRCIGVCATGTLAQGPTGYRVQLGGKLGRHPRLARELPGIFPAAAVVAIVRACIDLYKANSLDGRRFADVLTETDFQRLARRFAPKCTPS